MKRHVMAIIGGLFAGLVITFLAVVVLTPTRRDPWEDELPTNGNGHYLTVNGGDFHHARRPTAGWVQAGAGSLFVSSEEDRETGEHR
jgi:hypothetical protein